MIGEGALLFLSLYPWNLGISGIYTLGDYSTDRHYGSEKVFVSVDRRRKDMLVAGYEHLTITDDFGTYRQDNLLFRGVFWLRPEFRLGSVAGISQSNSVSEGWLIGAQVEGDLPWLGYSVDYTYLEFQGWEPQPDYWVITEFPITQWTFGISQEYGPMLVREVASAQRTMGNDYLKVTGKVSCRLGDRIIATVYGESGESRYALDPYLLVLDNNPDILKLSFGLHVLFQISRNFSVSCEALRKEYTPVFQFDGSTDYHVRYLAFGLLLRL